MADKPKPDGGGGGGDNFWTIVVVIIFVTLAIQKTSWGSRLFGTSTSTSTPSSTVSGTKYSDPEWGITFEYPEGWKVNKVGDHVDIVGPSKQVISMGGRQTECSDFAGTDTSCRTVLNTPVYTSDHDADTRAAFDLVTKTMRNK